PPDVVRDQLLLRLGAAARAAIAILQSHRPLVQPQTIGRHVPNAMPLVCRLLGRKNKGPDCEFQRQNPRRECRKTGPSPRGKTNESWPGPAAARDHRHTLAALSFPTANCTYRTPIAKLFMV